MVSHPMVQDEKCLSALCSTWVQVPRGDEENVSLPRVLGVQILRVEVRAKPGFKFIGSEYPEDNQLRWVSIPLCTAVVTIVTVPVF